jgi:hypothetical protein
MQRGGEVMRVAARGRGTLPAARSDAGSQVRRAGTTLLGRIFWRFAGPVWRVLRCRFMRGVNICMGTVAALVVLIVGGLCLLLANGPIPLDFATPWLAGAVAKNFDNRFKVDIGGTVLELDEHSRPAIRNRAITVRDHDGTVIASAPKAEVGFSVASLLSGRPQRLNLVGAELAVRVEADGQVTVSAGADERPLGFASAPAVAGFRSADVTPSATGGGAADAGHGLQESLAAFLTWVDSLSAFGLDGGELTEIGLKSGNLVVDDKRNGQQSRFENIRLSLTRPNAGQLEFELASEDANHPWLVLASIKPGENGARVIDLDAQKVMLKDLLLALRVDGGQIDTDATLSARLRAEFSPDGSAQTAAGRIIVGPGSFVDTGDPEARITIDHAEMRPDWNAARRLLTVPFEVRSGGTRLTLTAHAEAPAEPGGSWALHLENSGLTVLAPVNVIDEPVVLNRVAVQSRIDPVMRQFNIEHAEIAGKGVGVTMSGTLDYSTPDPRLKVRLNTRKLPLAAFKQLWPAVVTPPVRRFIIERSSGGMIEQGEIVTDAPISTLRSGGPPVPDNGLSIQIQTSGVTVRPFDGLPDIRDADLVSITKSRNTTVKLGRGTIAMPSGRRLTMSNGVFDVPDTSVKNPPAKVRAKVDGPMAAAAELLSMDRLKDAAGVPIDPTVSRGNVASTVNLGMSLGQEIKSSTINYAITADIKDFAADHFFMSQKVEAQTLHATADNRGFQVKGDVRIGGAPASVELHRTGEESDTEVHVTGTLDEAARTRFGLDANGAVAGPVGVKIAGRVALRGDTDSRLTVEADFTQAKFDNLVPGWSKVPKAPAKAAFTYVGRGKQARLEDIAFDGNGASIRGAVELDQNGEFATGTFPVFGLAEGDKANLQLERTPDNLWKATIRGDTFDGRSFIKTSMSGGPEPKQRRPAIDFDVDAKLGVVVGFKGEVLRGLDLHVMRRGGALRSLAAMARFAGDGVLQGELRGKPGGGQQTVYLESSDAGALFRFSDTYSRMYGGRMWIAMDPPTQDGAKKEGLIEVRDFTVRGEAALDSFAAGTPNGVPFSGMRVKFTRQPGRMTIHEGWVRGPTVGGNIEGVMDYAGNELHLRGTFVPLYALNTAFSEIPLVGDLLGGKGGMIGSMNYEVVGSPGTPVLRVNPISAVAPIFTRKLLEFPSSLSNDRFPAPTANWDRDSMTR